MRIREIEDILDLEEEMLCIWEDFNANRE